MPRPWHGGKNTTVHTLSPLESLRPKAKVDTGPIDPHTVSTMTNKTGYGRSVLVLIA